MTLLMADYLRVVTSYIPSPLVSLEALSYIQALAESLPPISTACLECRLGEGKDRVDFLVAFPCMALNLPEGFPIHPVWQAFTHFCQDWTNPATELCQIIDYTWFEFDLIEKPSQVPIPCIGFTLNQEAIKDCRLREIAIEYLIKLLQPSDPLLLESNIQTCADALPNGARIAHIGAMLSRSSKAVRLVAKGIPPQQLPDYLEQVGWKDSADKLPTLLPDLSNFVDSIALAFDVGNHIYSRIGLECFFEKQPFDDELVWQTFLDDYLVKEGLCTPAKRNALLAWPGFTQKADQPELWPNSLNQLDCLLNAKASSVFCRTLNHIKIVYQPSRSLSAKAYPFFKHLYLERNSLANRNLQQEDIHYSHSTE